MDEGRQSSTEAIFLSVVNYGDPQNLVSPEDFKDIVLGVLQNGMKGIHLTTTKPNDLSSYSIDMYKCSDFMLLSCLSAMEALLQSVSEKNVCTLIASAKSYSSSSIHNKPTETSPHHQEHSESVQSSQIWYRNTAKQLSASNVAELLVKYLVFGNKITSFLARKTLLSGLCSQHIETPHLLSLLKQELNAGRYFCVPLIEILRDMMSQKRFKDRQIHRKTFNLLKEINLENLVETQFKENQSSYIHTGGLLEYLSLIRKVIKFGIHQFDTNVFQDFSYITKIVSKILLPLIDCFFTAAKTDNVYFICLESIKAINTLLDIRFIEAKSIFQEGIINICTRLQTKVLLYIQIAGKSNLFSGFNFVGTILSSKEKTSISVSALTRQMVLLALKTYCATLNGDCSYTAVMDDLKCLWDEVGCAINGTEGQVTKDWLPVVFADQDDQWIIALFCLLIIHKEIKKRQNNSPKCVTVDTKMTDSYKCSSSFLHHTVCPHRLFLQLASFVDYDHLVLVDFLTSSETPFLPYFTQYLHFLKKDWQDFVLVCSNEDTDVKLGQSDPEMCKPHKHPESKQGSFEAAESVKTFPAVETSSHYFTRISEEASYSDNLLPLSPTRKSVLCSGGPVQNAVAASHIDAHPTEMLKDQTVFSKDALTSVILTDQNLSLNHSYLSEILKDPLQCSVATSSDDMFLVTLSKDFLQTSTAVYYNPLLNSASTSRTIVSSIASPGDHLHNSSVPFRDEQNKSSINQCSKKQEHSISQSCVCDDIVLDERCGGRSLSLVAYSDSDSEDDTQTRNIELQATKQTMKRCLFSDLYSDIECAGETQNMKATNIDLQATKQTMKRCSSSDLDSDIECSGETQNLKTTNIDLQATKQTMKRCLSSDSDSNSCIGSSSETDKSSFSLHRSDSNDVCTSLSHESTLGDITDENKCSKKLDNVLGMLIRLRLHIERLDHSSLFPYNPKPLVTLLEACEELYETPSGS